MLNEYTPTSTALDALSNIATIAAPDAHPWTRPDRPSRGEVITTTAAAGMDDDTSNAMDLWCAFLRIIDECVSPETNRVRANTMRAWTDGVFGEADKRRLSAFYSSAQAKGILTRVDEEKSSDSKGGNSNKMAPIYAVDRHLLLAARREPAIYAPKSCLPQRPRLRGARLTVPTEPTPAAAAPVAAPECVWDLDSGALF